MSQRHLFNSADGLVPKALRGILASNPRLALDEANRVVFDTGSPKSTVSIISGGGSGHEPAWSGYVGENLLAAAAQGDIFASPSTKQILAAVEAVPSDKGSLLVITNYTGDCLHFGLAAEKSVARGNPCRMLICGDDVSVGRKGGSLVGRRGLSAQIGVCKILGAASAQGASLDALYDLGQAFINQIASMAVTLDHCHVPGRAEAGFLEGDVVEIGTGPHNEPGYKKLSPAPSPQDLVKTVLTYCLDENDSDRGYVKFQPGDETVAMISNMGGMSHLEMGALVDEVLDQLDHDWKIVPVRVYSGFIETSLNAPAFSISVINISAVARTSNYTVEQIKELLDTRTDTAWEAFAGAQKARRPRAEQLVQIPEEHKEKVDASKDVKIDPTILEKMVRNACEVLAAAEPDLTKWDMIMGDGDCGETLKTGATALLDAIQTKKITAEGSILSVLVELEDILESKMGGTLGGILGIFFVSLRSAVQDNHELAKTQGVEAVWSKSLLSALRSLERYTPAKVGDRTVMDTLIPFAEAMTSGNFQDGVAAAVKGAESTKTLKPRLGRATYVAAGKSDNEELPPDPGAWGAMVAIKGLLDAL
ncbi:dihydroxyacetone kinase [Thozetella sp. PMI_491]|nr:dihydroxyacetone kinase [Thozetella sp. PMI_491]